MDYHADRFHDHSLVLLDDDDPVAVLPANAVGSVMQSHGGLSYGGFVIGRAVTAPVMLDIFERTISYLRDEGFSTLIYTAMPHLYHLVPAEEDLYALFRFGARVQARTVLTVVDSSNRLPLQERRRRGIRKATVAGVVIAETDKWEEFWSILVDHLRDKFSSRPVHSLAEILLLRSRFPENIRLFTADVAGTVVAGTVIYESQRVAHAQYIAASDRGREVGALDLLFGTLLEKTFAQKRYFDFGSSNEEQGRVLNVGLIEQKSGFGGRAVVLDSYEMRF